MNMLDVQDKLKGLSEQQLVQAMQAPTENVPQFLVLSEITRRKRMRDSMQQQDTGATVAQEAVAAAGVPQGGIADMARALAPKTDMTQNTGAMPVQGMYGGGYVQKMAAGDLIVREGRRYIEQEDGSYLGDDGIPVDLDLTADDRTFGQRYIGDPLRSLFKPVGDSMRETLEPVGDSMRETMQPFGESMTEAMQPVGEAMTSAMQPVGGDIRSLFRGQPEPQLSRQAQFEPTTESDQDAFNRARMRQLLPFTEETGIVDPEAARAAGIDVPPVIGPAFEQRGREQSPTDVTDAIAAQTEAAKVAADAAEKKAADEGQKATSTNTSGGRSGGSGGVGGASGATSYEQELINAMQRAERRAQQDKWLALAQVGLGLMSSTQPTLGGALGEAGIAGLQSYQGARDEYETERLGLSKELAGIEAARASQRAAAAKASSGPTLQQLIDARDALYTKSTNELGESVVAPMQGAEGEIAQINAAIRSRVGSIAAPTM